MFGIRKGAAIQFELGEIGADADALLLSHPCRIARFWVKPRTQHRLLLLKRTVASGHLVRAELPLSMWLLLHV